MLHITPLIPRRLLRSPSLLAPQHPNILARKEAGELWPHLTLMLAKLDADPGPLEDFLGASPPRAVGVCDNTKM